MHPLTLTSLSTKPRRTDNFKEEIQREVFHLANDYVRAAAQSFVFKVRQSTSYEEVNFEHISRTESRLLRVQYTRISNLTLIVLEQSTITL